jgi:hypothetical protein
MSVSKRHDEGNNFLRKNDTLIILGNLVNLAHPSIGAFNAN